MIEKDKIDSPPIVTPIQTELHRHLDVSIRTTTLLELAKKRGLESESTSLERFREKLYIQTPLSDLNSVLSQFSLFQKVLDRPEVLDRVAYEAVEDSYNEGTRVVELRFSPSFVSEHHSLSWEEILLSFQRGINRALATYPEMKAGLICIASRDYGVEAVEKTLDFYINNNQNLIGIDLAGEEVQYPCKIYETSFKRIRSLPDGKNQRITIHAGEASGPENIWAAIELLGAQRIGHGVHCIQDPELMRVLADRRICLEICPTSNWLTQAVQSLNKHPLPQIFRAGIPVSINTDDPGIFNTTLPNEIRICKESMGMSDAEISACLAHAFQSSFIFSHLSP